MSSPSDRPIAVRELCAFAAKTGDLDLRFTPSPTGLEGIAGHAKVTGRRGGGYQREVVLEGCFGAVAVRGKADGQHDSPLWLEEIKTHRGPVEQIPANHRTLHWAQLKMYGALLVQQRGLETLTLQLTAFNIDSEKEHHEVQHFNAAALLGFAEALTEAFSVWQQQEQQHRDRRDAALTAMAFPHAVMHAGQRQLATAVYRSVSGDGQLMAQAPTGIGKSIGTLFPALKAMAEGAVDKIFYLTAKTSGRQVALGALASLGRDAPMLLRVLELVARDKACVHPDKACHGESCPLAKGFYDRLPAARTAAATLGTLDQAALRAVADDHAVCPYYLSQEMARWADVVVGDYNYYLDQTALLHGLTVANDWKVAVLIDEAHNLVERGRSMYSASLSLASFRAVRKEVPTALRRSVSAVVNAWTALHAESSPAYRLLDEPPPKLVGTLSRLSEKIDQHLVSQAQPLSSDLQRLYFDVLNWLGLAESFGDHSLCDVADPQQAEGRRRRTLLGLAPVSRQPESVLSIRNVLPAAFLQKRWDTAASTAVFSATLQPMGHYAQLLGFGERLRTIDVPSPFSAQQLEVRVVDAISTRYQDRERSALPIAELIAAQYRKAPGNYLAFFSSYAYLEQVVAALREAAPDLPLRVQDRGMDEAARQAFLDAFTEESAGVGFAVLGGAFAEGVDLPGRRLIGVFVATLGLPQLNPVNEAIRERMELLLGRGCGYDATYLFPGLQKVVQAAGRLVRSTEDRGVVVLIDDRYRRREVRELLPRWWQS